MFENYSDILSVNDLCELLRIGKNTAYKLLQSGQVESVLIAGKYRISKKSVIKLIESSIN